MDRLLDPLLRFLRVRRVRSYISRGAVVLDVGCGFKARLLRSLLPLISKGIGIDMDVPEGEEGNITLKKGLLEKTLDQETSSVDVVTLTAVLEHLQYPEDILKEIYRVLRPGGTLIITVPTWAARPVLEVLAYKLHVIEEGEIRDHKRYFWKRDLSRMLVSAGFKTEHITQAYFEAGFNLFAVAKK
ncbi:MAG: hypothetical protein A3H69_05025 [Candidatus Sungbacteria bacterium RIFCSPLOWO2_02_FULL_47_9]|uniref:Methyltransferase type 11 domain-containing protein n=1 Tax=Candidatus Sungbacteria bacterium RIFCSPHIGHO2_01_FULL_47_32 TaxID=1802264 RepID=A0A1G2K5D1_9BACT|nr:MAG: Methyltransferase type 11 [Parcubacteria group bacterium GW2011_GWA2_47_10]OGZ94649.1 MAG: hypothetical protein A2633_01365 [Candidatus Sungbacteria bacterium RIFCSPHIGHO2_01_FULL_47_32]OGZ98158.1 MAG: hypothetical protein A3D57_03000 [Candidatus Sungbacteria bacterium RIFCSPHIGHO2_02_FULL_46_12]OHA04821.1 MAG: hypothetical protein A3A28_04940 [Candidatus Sungbacteria bacterium RIFCSPLOWO2_01_FULL_47_32]OHA11988.1 MAG: hypothetical protein A3H69_05025 [Candidatus Sungbacteria bacterium 